MTRPEAVPARPVTVPADRLRAAGATDRGRVRGNNEDRLHVDVERGIFLVVDGVGGHAAGEIAAAIARDVIVERLQRGMWTPAQRVREAIALANNEILRQAESSPEHEGMTCVVTLALLEDGGFTIGHVGDTRLYALSPQGIVKLTHDHSPIGEREDAQEISEVDAMHHPRRNEVFRDVGSTFHDPDDEDFIEVVETTFEPDSAVLLCSDGLSDMLTSTAIERTVRQHAGNPAAVTQALIEAANEAGGKDNVTVVYVEGSRFAETPAAATGAPGARLQPRLGQRLVASRAAWLTVGVLAGLALGLGLVLTLGLDAPLATEGGRTLAVGGVAPDNYPSITSALAVARPRDVVRVEPGEYAEAVVLPAGVDLAARTPGHVTLVAPPGRDDWVSVTAEGSLGNRVSGVRVLGRPDAPIAVGFRLAGHDLVVDDVVVEGNVGVGMDILNDGAVLVRSSRFAGLQGLPMKIGHAAKPVVRQNVFVRGVTGPHKVALDVATGAAPSFLDNLFVGYADTDLVLAGQTATSPTRGNRAGPSTSRGKELLQGNYLVRAP